MNQLTFWNSAASAALREVGARALALRTDAIFRMVRGATYEDGHTHQRAVDEMCEVLLKEDATMENLADVNDANYRFWQEGA
jgi:hypothetical protein